MSKYDTGLHGRLFMWRVLGGHATHLGGLLLFFAFGVLGQINQPPPPASGPGSTNNYLYQSFLETDLGTNANEYWIFEPRSPQPVSAPLIVFNHGYGATDPTAYTAWIYHIVQRGNIVVYPRYQMDDTNPPPPQYITNALIAVTNAIRWLQTNGTSTLPQLDKFAVVGHSIGGVLTANMAAMGSAFGLPPVLAAMCAQPGKSWGPPVAICPLANLSQISSNTLLLSIAGAEDRLVFSVDASNIYFQSINVPAMNKDFILTRSDYYGSPALISDHLDPCSTAPSNIPPYTNFPPDAHDFYSFWKLFDALTDAAFYGTNREYALGGTPQQTFMGCWSDGTPVNPLISAANPVPLTISPTGNQCVVSWIPPMANFTLQTNATLAASAGWLPFYAIPSPTNGQYFVTQSVSGVSLYFRLAPQ